MTYSNETNNNNNNRAKKAGLSWWRRTYGTFSGPTEEIEKSSSTAKVPNLILKHDIGPRKVPSQVMSSHGWGREFWKPTVRKQDLANHPNPTARSHAYREITGLSEEEEDLYSCIVARGVKEAKVELDKIAGLDELEDVQSGPVH
jgi:hypothetical protein